MCLNIQLKWDGNLIKYCKNCLKKWRQAQQTGANYIPFINADVFNVFIIGDDNSYKCINSDKMIIDH